MTTPAVISFGAKADAAAPTATVPNMFGAGSGSVTTVPVFSFGAKSDESKAPVTAAPNMFGAKEGKY